MTDTSYTITGATRRSRFLCLCDHATNYVPPSIGHDSLGLPAEDMVRHIAYDPGADGVTQALAERLDAPAIGTNFSRLVIDPNRGEDDPTLIMRLYDGSIIPANRDVDDAEKARRIDAFHRPYHTATADLAAEREEPILISIHSFTPQLRGRAPRPWHIGILYADDTRLAVPLMDQFAADPDLCVGNNEPYAGSLVGDTMDRHALKHGRPHVLIELRNDLISNHEDQVAWAERLAIAIDKAVGAANL
ncbi:N-formylglutamate amidohydrolase [Litoreibacter roseus]|uniref:N-formylglutamate amidohydrolase n=1 Tax=Litoreibacter roseus TaxID=2601869 RepID=A0A6N6JGQ8_9RHOB|nr:N-formylglutamate amidohydrolase [Litoreibacter roseus]GFE65030.1 N-formylglutamate amidohydrolase [Litoreibacter roseus]